MMLQSSNPLSRPLLIGEVLDTGFRLFRASLLRSLPLSAALVIAAQWPTFYDTLHGSLSEPLLHKGAVWWLVYLIAAGFGAWMAGAILMRQSMRAADTLRLRELLLTTLVRVPGAIGVTLVVSALLIAPVLIALTGLLPPIVMILLAVVSLWLCGRLALAVPIYWCERTSAATALRSSFALVRGRFWRLLAIAVVAFAVVLVFFFMLALLSAVVAPLVGLTDIAVIGALQAVVAVLVGAVAAPLATALSIIVLQDFRRRQADGASVRR
ncbi:MAG: glycerophosphoryl diester phosphodiesterase membrane domain-containing protein [Pseudomonadales bacterium]|nr:glycerophosphoryl diester phosphodiesterase membrane domain-containing protein [Pseudomonadales bacterium]